MNRRLGLAVVLLAAGCAKGRSGLTDDGGVVDGPSGGRVDARVIDAPERPDAAPIDAAPIDAPPPVIDAPPPMIDAPPPMVDAAVPPDACVPVVTELLANGAFDASPLGTGWVQSPYDSSLPIITSDDGPVEHTAPNKAWLGGFESDFLDTADDQMYQQVTVPAGTTQLVLTGVYWVGTDETPGTTIYDAATVAFTQTNGTLIVNAMSLTNLTPTAGWTPIEYVVPANLSGQTIRLRFASTNDFLNATSFWFDTLSLKATHCP